jgi:hypothetical protein
MQFLNSCVECFHGVVNLLYISFNVSYYWNITVVVVVILYWLDLQLPVQSVPFTTYIVSSNPAQTRYTRHNIK